MSEEQSLINSLLTAGNEDSLPSPNTPSGLALESHPSPIPLCNLDFYHAGSVSTTPESEVESSLAYKGTERYGSMSRNNRKLRKRHELAESKVSEENIANSEFTRTHNVGYNDSSDSENSDLEETGNRNCEEVSQEVTRISEIVGDTNNACTTSKATTSKATTSKATTSKATTSKAVQTNLVWSEVENLFKIFSDMDMDSVDLDGMKQILLRLKYELIGKQGVPPPTVNFDEPASEGSLSDETLSEVGGSQHENEGLGLEKNTGIPPKKSVHIYDDEFRQSFGGSDASSLRMSSAHCIGQRKQTLPEDGTIFDQFRAQGEEAVKVKPEILKYVSEKHDMRPPDIESMHVRGWHEGLCQFCGQSLLEIPTIEQIEHPVISLQLQYCCPEFKFFITLSLSNEENASVVDEVIDINSNDSAKNKKATIKEKMADRQREREIEKQKAAAAQQANFFAFAKQMKVVQYSLASTKCMDDGWTIKPTSPLPPAPVDENQFEVEVNSTLLQTAGVLMEKSYDNGNPFLTIFPDGTGCCYYPNGNVAVMICSTEKGKYTYIVQSNKCYDDLDDSGLLAVFEPDGNSVCYYKNEKIRTFINATGGIELDPKGRRKKRWQWYFIKGHVHTPPFHPLHISLNKFLSVRVLDQHNIVLTFSSSRRSVRFNVGAQLKMRPRNYRGQFQGDESEKQLVQKKKKINYILNNLHSALRLPKSSRAFSTIPFQRKKEELGNMVPRACVSSIGHLPPIDAKQAVIIT